MIEIILLIVFISSLAGLIIIFRQKACLFHESIELVSEKINGQEIIAKIKEISPVKNFGP